MTYLYSPCNSLTPCNSVELSSFNLIQRRGRNTELHRGSEFHREKYIKIIF